jgi:hypothetical protein
MATEVNQEERTTTEGTANHPAIVEPAQPGGTPRIYLYTSLSSGSSYVFPFRVILTLGKYSTIAYRNSPESSEDWI